MYSPGYGYGMFRNWVKKPKKTDYKLSHNIIAGVILVVATSAIFLGQLYQALKPRYNDPDA